MTEVTPERFAQVVWVALIAIWLYLTRAGIRARRWQSEGRCVRCGTSETSTTFRGERFCGSCAARTAKAHQLGFRFFAGMGVAGGVLATLGFLSNIQRGFTVNLTALAMVGPAVLGAIAFAFWIRNRA